MSDRQTFLAAIRESPLDDTVRLVYADWLDQHGSGDLDAATAKFIRASCSRGQALMPRAGYAWIHANWKRLVPNLVERHPNFSVRGKKGRVISTLWAVGRGAKRAFLLHYCRGFVTHVAFWSFRVNRLLEVIREDQPFTNLHKVEVEMRRREAVERANAERERHRTGTLHRLGEGQ